LIGNVWVDVIPLNIKGTRSSVHR